MKLGEEEIEVRLDFGPGQRRDANGNLDDLLQIVASETPLQLLSRLAESVAVFRVGRKLRGRQPICRGGGGPLHVAAEQRKGGMLHEPTKRVQELSSSGARVDPMVGRE